VGYDRSVFYISGRFGDTFLEQNLKPSFKSGRTSVGVWSCYCGNEMGLSVILEKGERMTAARHLVTLKKSIVLLYHCMVQKYRKEVVMQEQNVS
jgi:hypothetical protein